ncbi:MAG: ABC transporter substrate-binding protein [Beijerinckiaceae bacterium]|jgi:NitT/TauT family transport system substrate-binding protein|nr:ABC transporter substrate-binding protein [Beijerinckiaceae bacterium]
MLKQTMLLHAAALAATLTVTALPAQAQTKVTAGVAAFNEALLPVFTAREKGYFKAEGLDVEMVDFKGGAPAVQALAGGSIDVCFCAADHVIRLRARRQPALVLVGLDAFHSYALIAKQDAPYTNLASLKGKRVGITSPGSFTDNTIRYSMKALGLNPERDFEITGAGGGATMQAALDTDRIAAGMFILTDIANIMQKAGAYKVVEDYRALPYPSFAAIALESYVKNSPKAAKGFARAVAKAMAELEKDPALGRAVLAKMFPTFSPQLVAEVAKSAIERAPKGGIVSAESIENLNKIVLATDDTLKAVTLQEAFDASVLKD